MWGTGLEGHTTGLYEGVDDDGRRRLGPRVVKDSGRLVHFQLAAQAQRGHDLPEVLHAR